MIAQLHSHFPVTAWQNDRELSFVNRNDFELRPISREQRIAQPAGDMLGVDRTIAPRQCGHSIDLDERQLTVLTRRGGSGSACRSIPTGYVEWRIPEGPFDAARWDEESYAVSLAPPEHWALADVVAVVDAGAKKIGSAENHQLAATSAYFPARLAEIPARLAAARDAIARRDLELLGATMEADAVSMHAVCMTSSPPSFYWNAGTLEIIHAVRAWREGGLAAYFTIDAGPNVHVICADGDRDEVARRLGALPGVQFTIANGAGAGAGAAAARVRAFAIRARRAAAMRWRRVRRRLCGAVRRGAGRRAALLPDL